MSQQNKAPRVLPPADIDGRERDEAYDIAAARDYRARIEAAMEEEEKAQLPEGSIVISLPREKKTLIQRFVEYMTTDPANYVEIAEKNLDVVQVK